ncbi:MAG: patatin-like phospholipase family protein [Verrucomicrobiota bacterium]
MKRVGLALGGGGAKGLAHIPLLEILDDFEIRPHGISCTSIGAIVGALYASGYSGREIREQVANLVISKGDTLKDIMNTKDFFKGFEFFDINFHRGAILKGDAFIDYLSELTKVERIEDLEIPLQIVATDFWTGEH